MNIAPDLQQALARQEEILGALGPAAPGIEGARLQADQARAWWNEGGPPMARVHDAHVPGPMRDIPVTVYVPRDAAALRPAFVFLHGGGFRVGSPRANDRQLRELAAAWGGIVVSADYAHMPEHVFPAAVQEAAAVFAWIAAHGGPWGIDGARLACGGLSAGANIAMGAAVHSGGVAAGWLRAAVSFVGVLDDALDTPSMNEFGDGPPPNRESVRTSLGSYVTQAQRDDPRFNPMRADPNALPPMFLAAAELDVYRDGSVRLAQRLQDAGADPELKVYPGMTHLFVGYSRMVGAARECIGDAAAFLSRRLPANAGGGA